MRRIAAPLSALFIVAAILPIQPARAATASITTYFNDCPGYGGVAICSGVVPSFDGTKLDVDLSLPAGGTGARHPLIVMAHGFANNKHEWESLSDEGDGADKWHWNSHWFAEHGYYVLNYTARGFRDPGPDRVDEPSTPAPAFGSDDPSDPNARIYLKSREVEIRDTQWLSALAAAAFPDLDPERVAITGGSYGGGESWTQAAQSAWTFPHQRDASLPVLQLQVAVPKYPWTDLGYSLAPNGHPGPAPGGAYSSSSGDPASELGAGNPVGTIKYSYATGFFALGVVDGTFTPQVLAWYARGVQVGDPYDAGAPGTDDPVIAQLREGLTEERSSYYQDEEAGGWLEQSSSREVAIFSISGWTDDLFPPLESFRQFKYLKALDPLWPVEVAVADVGHPRAQNRPSQWQRLNDQAWSFLRSQIEGSHRQQTTVSSMPTICPQQAEGDGAAIERLTGRTPEDLAQGSLSVDYESGDTLLNRKPPTPPALDPIDPDNAQTDPAFGAEVFHLPACRVSVAPVDPVPGARYTAVSTPLAVPRTYVGLGSVEVSYTLAGGTGATLNARLWDVSPDGKTQLLVTRGTYRIDGPGYDTVPSGTIQLPFFGNDWTFEAGHSIRLDLTLVDSPTLLASNQPTTLTFNAPRVTLPTREATTLTLVEA
jgi:predicted acyl esterase